MTLVVKEFKCFGDRPHRSRQLAPQERSGPGSVARGGTGLAGCAGAQEGEFGPRAATGPVGSQGGWREGAGCPGCSGGGDHKKGATFIVIALSKRTAQSAYSLAIWHSIAGPETMRTGKSTP